MKLFELFATLGLESDDFEAKLAAATRQGEDFAEAIARAGASGETALGDALAAAVDAGSEAVATLDGMLDGYRARLEGCEAGLDRLSAAAGAALRSFDMPDPASVARDIQAWWDGVVASLNLRLPTPSTGSGTAGGSAASTYGGGSDSPTRASNQAAKAFATGIEYVPYNDFPAYLHEGEAVLTKLEANDWRSGGQQPSLDLNALRDAVTAAVREGMQGVGLYIDRERLGETLTEPVSRNIADLAWAGRYA